ncbi:hypothetical protein TNCV_311201 [Trichonephila clavipes]|nr:hypothetical protein TNCV_311201 [Trichonephila clavipes]
MQRQVMVTETVRSCSAYNLAEPIPTDEAFLITFKQIWFEHHADNSMILLRSKASFKEENPWQWFKSSYPSTPTIKSRKDYRITEYLECHHAA